MKRVTLEEMRAALAAVPLTPVMGTYFDVPARNSLADAGCLVSREQVLCGCPLTIITCHRHPNLLNEIEGWSRTAAHGHLFSFVFGEFGDEYRQEFASSYDTGRESVLGAGLCQAEIDGRTDGLLIRKHFPPNREVLAT